MSAAVFGRLFGFLTVRHSSNRSSQKILCRQLPYRFFVSIQTTNTSHTMDRFDIPEQTRSLMAAAVRLGACDTADILAMGATHGDNWAAIHDEIIGYTYVNRHSEDGRNTHAMLMAILEAPTQEEIEN
jgi:hypothetical protein